MQNDRIEIESKFGLEGGYEEVRLVFGPHYFIELRREGKGVTLYLGATHHGFKADASQVNGELEQIINEIREAHPQNTID